MAIERSRMVKISEPASEPVGRDADDPVTLDVSVLGPPAARRRGWVWAMLAGAVGVAVAAAWGFSGSQGADWTVAQSERSDLPIEVVAVGTLEPVSTVEIGSDLTGKLLAIQVEENESVTAGQILAEIDPEPFQAAVSEAQARVAGAEAALTKAKIERERTVAARDRAERLLARGASTAVESEQAVLDARAAEASVASASAELAQARASRVTAERDLADTTIRSPIDGVVLHRFVEPGQTVVSAMSATALFEVASDLSSLRVDAGIDEADIGQVVPGLPVTFTVSAWTDVTFDATVARVDVAPDPDEDVVEYDALLLVDNRDGRLRPGMTVTAAIRVQTLEDVVTVPNLALRWRPEGAGKDTSEGDVVHVLVDGTWTAVPVEVLGTDGTRSAVRGIEAGTDVATGGGT